MISKAIFKNINGVICLLCSKCGKVIKCQPDFNTMERYTIDGVVSMSARYCHEHQYMDMVGQEKEREMRKLNIKEKLREGMVGNEEE